MVPSPSKTHRLRDGIYHRVPASLRFASLAFLQRQRRDVGQVPGEGLLVGRPTSRWSDVLMTEDAVEPPLMPDGHIHHRRDAVDIEIEDAQLAGASVGARLVRRDDTVFADGGEIAREVARPQDVAGLVSTLSANKAVLTPNRVSVR
jgi:hypothetical protein